MLNIFQLCDIHSLCMRVLLAYFSYDVCVEQINLDLFWGNFKTKVLLCNSVSRSTHSFNEGKSPIVNVSLQAK